MKRIYSAILLLVIASTPALSQTYVGAQLALGIPAGEFSNDYQIGYGGSAQFLYNLVEDNLWIEGELGFLYFGYSSEIKEDQSGHLQSIPLLASIRYELSKGLFRPYLGGSAGIHIATRKIETTTPVGVSQASRSESSLGVAILGGFLYPITQTISLDVKAAYHIVLFEDVFDTPSFLVVKAGIVLPIQF